MPVFLKSVGKTAKANLDSALSTVRFFASGGHKLEPSMNQEFSSFFGRDFSRVRVYSDGSAEEATRFVGASAFTIGHHVVISPSLYPPRTKQAHRILAHELAHVAQSPGSGSLKTDAAFPIGSPVDQSERSAEAAALAASDPKTRGKGSMPAMSSGNLVLRRQGGIVPSKEFSQYRVVQTPLPKREGLKVLAFDCGYSVNSIEHQDFSTAVHIELGYTRDSKSKYADPSNLNWFQTLSTNYKTDSRELPPADTATYQYVDGSDDGQTAAFYNKINGSIFQDDMRRLSLKDRDVIFKAETSVIGISPDGLEILETIEWGFEMKRDGTLKRRIRPHHVEPSAYHLSKFNELPRPASNGR